MDESSTSTVNQLAAYLQGQATGSGESISNNIQYCQTWPNWQWQYVQPTCHHEHVYSEDEKLLLNAIRRDERLKDKTLKFVLAELLKSLKE